MAPPRHKFDKLKAEKVKFLAGIGLPKAQISYLCDFSDETLDKYYRDHYENGKATANAKVASFLFQQAQENLTAAMFWAKTQMRWREAAQEIEVTNVNPAVNISLTKIEPNSAPKAIEASATQPEHRHLPAPEAEPGFPDDS